MRAETRTEGWTATATPLGDPPVSRGQDPVPSASLHVSRYFLKHTLLEQAFDQLCVAGFRCTNPSNPTEKEKETAHLGWLVPVLTAPPPRLTFRT